MNYSRLRNAAATVHWQRTWIQCKKKKSVKGKNARGTTYRNSARSDIGRLALWVIVTDLTAGREELTAVVRYFGKEGVNTPLRRTLHRRAGCTRAAANVPPLAGRAVRAPRVRNAPTPAPANAHAIAVRTRLLLIKSEVKRGTKTSYTLIPLAPLGIGTGIPYPRGYTGFTRAGTGTGSVGYTRVTRGLPAGKPVPVPAGTGAQPPRVRVRVVAGIPTGLPVPMPKHRIQRRAAKTNTNGGSNWWLEEVGNGSGGACEWVRAGVGGRGKRRWMEEARRLQPLNSGDFFICLRTAATSTIIDGRLRKISSGLKSN
ncbi:hypothetical protein GGX14DRAFT_581552 [Mycena pura]|uniref:Uncharacterized protein n=1 Tax=Mycena pura TaxID=153505 RepID=A0AAD6YU82_9AGAR|nr:hypothetical protein GGX14DRAFT_581552 [Mycena pura]